MYSYLKSKVVQEGRTLQRCKSLESNVGTFKQRLGLKAVQETRILIFYKSLRVLVAIAMREWRVRLQNLEEAGNGKSESEK